MRLEIETPCGGIVVHLHHGASAELEPAPTWRHVPQANPSRWHAHAARRHGVWTVDVGWTESHGHRADALDRRRRKIAEECRAVLRSLQRVSLIEAERRWWAARLHMLPAEVHAARSAYLAKQAQLDEARLAMKQIGSPGDMAERKIRGD